jgi:peptidase M1-like protein
MKNTPLVVAMLAVAACTTQTAPTPVTSSGTVSTGPTSRAIRRDIPMTNAIRRAHAAGTRDSTGRPGRNYWQQWVDYTINARLDVPTSTITGRETIALRNNSDSTLREIRLRLDQNIFAPQAARLESPGSTVEITAGMKITRATVNGQTVNLNPGPNASTSGGPILFGGDLTAARIALQNTIAAKGTATLEIEWNFKVPNVLGGRGIRMGRLADSLYQVAQWYPRVAVYDDLRGWDSEPYLGPSEFYNNFGRWDVSLDVPAGWLVGATGVLQNGEQVLSSTTRERLSHVLESDSVRTIVGANEMGAGRATSAGDRLVWRFVADTANDFAWATSRSYVWDATRATIPERGPVPIHILYRPGSGEFKPIGPVLRHALEFYSSLWFPYAFPQLTTSDGPELGMEYPMFLMSGLGAADHEAGHEWWPMMVSNNETWYGWMDEGFNQYMNVLSGAHSRKQPAMLDGMGQAYGQVSGTEYEPPMMWDANYGGPVYGFVTYGKAPQMLSMLGAIVGDTAVQRAMSDWAKAWRFKHPSPWDYMLFMNNSLGRDLGWFWYYWLFTTEAVQGSIQNVTTNGPQTVVTVRQDGQMPSPVVLRVEFAPTGPAITPMSNSVMMDPETAIVTYPVDVWFGGSRTFDATLNFGGRGITKITFDPFRRFPDRDARDNVWPR